MPELPEVETIKTAISKGIGKSQIIDVIINNGRLREQVPNDLPKKIKGTTIIGYKRIAKYIIMELSNGLDLIWHMGMSGKIKLTDYMPDKLDKHDHIIIVTDGGIIIYNDPRRFGLLVYCKKDNLNKCRWFSKTGIDPFDNNLNNDYLYEQLQRHAKLPIKLALLNQEIIAGIGNIYASEILYESRILPTRISKDVSLSECETLIKNIRNILQKAILAGGSTLRDYKKPDGSMGYFQQQHCVYNKTGQRCPDCKCDIAKTGGIKRSVMGGRSTFYCESLQK